MDIFGVPTDLDGALMLVSKLRNENEEYSVSVEALQTELIALSQENKNLRSELTAEKVAADANARRHNIKVAEWEMELETRSQELEKLRNKVLTQEDINLLKFRLVEELEKPHQEHTNNLEKEVSKFRELYYKTKRDYEMLKEQHDHQRVHSTKFQDELDNLRQAEIDDLRIKNEKMTAELADSKLDAELRRSQRELTGAALRISNLSAELDESLAQKENTIREFDHMMRLKDRVVHEQAAKVKQVSSDFDSQRLHVMRLQEELVSSQTRLGELKKEFHESNKMQIQAKTKADEDEHKCRSRFSDLQLSAVQRQSEMENDQMVLSDALATAHRQVHMLEKVIEELNTKLLAKDTCCAQQVHQAREDEWIKQRELEFTTLQLERRTQTLETEKTHLIEDKLKREEARIVETREYSKKVDALESTKISLTNEIDKCRNRLEELELAQSKAKLMEDDFNRSKVEFETLKRMTTATQRDLVEANASLAIKEGEIKQMNEELDATRQSLRAEADAVRQTLSDAIANFAEEKKKAEGAANELFQRFGSLCQKFKAYKAKSRGERKSSEEIISGLESKLEAQTRQSTEVQEHYRRTTHELHNLQRKLDQFKAVIGNEGVRLAAGVSQPQPGLAKPFDEEQGRRNDKEINQLKQDIDAVIATDENVFLNN